MTKTIRYIDIGFDFDAHPVTGDVVRSYDDDAVIQSLKNLIQTEFYDAPMQPTKGSRLKGLLFEPLTSITVAAIRDEIYDVVEKYEPRVTNLDVETTLGSDEVSIDVRLKFNVINLPNPLVLDIVLERVR
jgi:phage baseplate assembly protein W